jgi:hypothetical protein
MSMINVVVMVGKFKAVSLDAEWTVLLKNSLYLSNGRKV